MPNPIRAPTPVPTPGPMSALRRRCPFVLMEMLTICARGKDCVPAPRWTTISPSVPLSSVPWICWGPGLEALPATRVCVPGASVFTLSQFEACAGADRPCPSAIVASKAPTAREVGIDFIWLVQHLRWRKTKMEPATAPSRNVKPNVGIESFKIERLSQALLRSRHPGRCQQGLRLGLEPGRTELRRRSYAQFKLRPGPSMYERPRGTPLDPLPVAFTMYRARRFD
jgi:hypothetical protein